MLQEYRENLNFPISIIWELTNRCASRCIYCSGNFENKYESNELSFDEKKKLVQELIQNKIFGVNLSGGEPFLCKDLEWIVDELTSSNIKVIIATSGASYDEKLIDKFSHNPLVSYCISIDSFQPTINDFQRGSMNTLPNVEHFINRLASGSEVRPYIQLECVLTQKNIKDIREYVENALKYPVTKIGFQPVIAMNKKTYDEKLNLSQADIDDCRNEINRMQAEFPNIHINLIEQYANIEKSYQNGRNWGGIITPEGDLLISVYLPYIFANLRKDSGLKAVWKSKLSMAWRNENIKNEISNIHTINDIEKLQEKYGFERIKLAY